MKKFQRSSGILLHPTSFPGKFGIGDFGKSAYQFIDFMEKSGQSLWQILPLNPTSFGDSPYQSFSAFAGNPLLISPEILLKKGYLSEEDLSSYPLFSETQVEYSKVIPTKMKLLQKAYDTFQKEGDFPTKQAFFHFCERNAFWLDDFTLFIALKDFIIQERKSQGFSEGWESFYEETKDYLTEIQQKDYYFGAVWTTWPKDLKHRNSKTLSHWKESLQTTIVFYAFLQFEFFLQWQSLKEYANKKGIQIIGDIPIFVALDSADTWSNQCLFYLDQSGYPTVVAGVPPDYFSKTGQLWGNPLYHWEEHKKTSYKWWLQRIQTTLTMIDILRIDHFRGFESYWAVPFGHKDATKGTWCKGPGSHFFSSLQKEMGNLPIIAEDLGILTNEVIQLRKDFQLPGMKVLQFAFGNSWNNDYLPHQCEKNSVTYTGTHDNDTTRGWYSTASQKEQDHFRRYMNSSGENVPWDFIRLASSSPSMFSIYPLQDVLGLDSKYRMNTPGVPWGNWQYRYKEEQLSPETSKFLYYITKLFGRLPEEKNS